MASPLTSSSADSLSSTPSTSSSRKTSPSPPFSSLSTHSIPSTSPSTTRLPPPASPTPRSHSVDALARTPQPFFSPSLARVPGAPTDSPTTFEFPADVRAGNSPERMSRGPSRRRQGGYRRTGGGGAGADTANQLEAKVVILGSQGVGKTSIVHRYTSGHFSYSLSSTIGASFLTKKLVIDGCKVRLQIWDTAGQERFRSMAPLYYRGALAAILVYDITNADSFADIKIWLEELRQNMSPDLIIHVVGSKGDLSSLRAVDLLTARRSIAEWVHPSPSSIPRDHSPPLARQLSRTLSTMPSITTSPPGPPSPPTPLPTLGARVRKMSTKLGVGPQGLNGVSGGTSSASSVSEGREGEMVRSGSKLGLTLGMGMRGRKSGEEERRSSEEERVEEMVRECGIEVEEVSAKDDFGIEDLFLHITRRLVERKSQIETNRVLRSRDSIMLGDNDAIDSPSSSSWCC